MSEERKDSGSGGGGEARGEASHSRAEAVGASGARDARDGAGGTGAGAVRYAVVGLGWIAQAAILPAFRNAGRNSRLVALVSGGREKREQLGRKYGVETFEYDDFERCLRTCEVDAVWIALPNSLHREYTERTAAAGVHVLCEKPMAVTEEDCRAMIAACERNDVRLMIAYRLHFDEANLRAVEIAQSGRIGEPRVFGSVFTQQVDEGDIRLQAELGGGPLLDIGIYCINAARYLFRAEPVEVHATHVQGREKRFREVAEATSVTLRFPDERLATFVCSFGAASANNYQLVGTKGSLRLENAYSFEAERWLGIVIGGDASDRTIPERDQFGPQLLYFSDCIRQNREPQPSGLEGLADVRIVQALESSAAGGKPEEVEPVEIGRRPGLEQRIDCPPIEAPELVGAEDPRGNS